MKFDLSQFEELDRTELLEITGGYYSTTGASHPISIQYENSYVIANSQNYQPSPGSSYGYTSGTTSGSTGGSGTGGSGQPTGYDPQSGWIDPNTGLGTVAPPVPGNYETITYSNGNGTFKYDPNTNTTTKISDQTNAQYAFNQNQQYRIIVMKDADGLPIVGHDGIIMQTPEGFMYVSNEGYADGTSDVTKNLGTNKNGVMIKANSLAELSYAMNRDLGASRTGAGSKGDLDGNRYEFASSFNISGEQAATVYGYLVNNYDNGYNVVFNNCNDLVQNALRTAGSSYGGQLNSYPNMYTDWLAGQVGVTTINVNSGYNF